MIIRNSIQCVICQEEIESTHKHDFKWCSCHALDDVKGCAVDGGFDYLRRIGKDYAETSLNEFSHIKELRSRVKLRYENFKEKYLSNIAEFALDEIFDSSKSEFIRKLIIQEKQWRNELYQDG